MNTVKTLKIKDNMYVNLLPVAVPKEVEVKANDDVMNQFLIFDRSGSMSYYLDDVINSAIKYCETLPDGSSVSVGYFSGTGEYNLSVPYTLKKEITGVVKTLNTYRDAISLTNFIQILEKVAETAGKINSKSSLFFFTDGCHNSGGGKSNIESALKQWSQFASISMFVGYGYIDRDMMSWMAKITDGSFIHLNDFSNFNKVLEDFGLAVEDSSPTVDVTLPLGNISHPISLSGKTVIEYTPDNGVVKYKPSKKGFKGLFYLTSELDKDAELVYEMDITFERGVRGLATISSQKNNVDEALDLLVFLGDKYLISSLYNSIAPDEFSEAEAKIRKSIFSTKGRFIEGEVKNFLPAPDAFCVLDAVDALNKDETVKMYLDDEDFIYERIGKKTAQKDGPYTIMESGLGVSLNGISFHKERLNVSISTSSQVSVVLDPKYFTLTSFTTDELKAHNIPEDYKVVRFRNYSIIADGRLQTKKLVLSDLQKHTIKTLGPIITKREDGKYVVDFSNIPIINKTYVKLTSAKTLAENIWEEKKLSDTISVYNALKKRLEEKNETKVLKKAEGLTEEATKFLFEKCYIKNGSYNPPVETLAGEDQYEAYAFSIDIKGFSKASASEVMKKVDAKGKITQREQLLAEAYQMFLDSAMPTMDDESQLKCIVDDIAKYNLELKKVRNSIQLSKFAIVLANKGKMDEFSSRENMMLPLDVKTYKEDLSLIFVFTIEKVVVKI